MNLAMHNDDLIVNALREVHKTHTRQVIIPKNVESVVITMIGVELEIGKDAIAI